jgi:CheY-like chemotaxis protein
MGFGSRRENPTKKVQNMSILVVDDNEDVSELFEAALTGGGHHIGTRARTKIHAQHIEQRIKAHGS